MLDLDDATLEVLGYGGGVRFYERLTAQIAARSVVADEVGKAQARARYKASPAVRARRLEHLYKWRAQNPEKWKALDKKHHSTPKGKASKARTWKKYYAKHRAELIEKNRQRRKASR